MSYYRVQHPGRSVQDLLDPEQQISVSWCSDTERSGVSVCRSLEDLATYLAQTGIPFDATWVVVACDGYLSEDRDEDTDMGALLIHPTEIVSVSPITDRLMGMIDAVWEDAA